jgi:WD40 repeat protein
MAAKREIEFPVESVAFGVGADGRLLLASGSRDHTVRVWDPLTGTPAGEPLTGHMGPVYSVAFGAGPDGRLLLASGSDDKTVRVWGPPSGVRVGEHMGPVFSVAFGAGPDGRLLLASGSDDKTVRVWEPATGACTATLRRTSVIRSITAAGLTLAIGDDLGICVTELAG